jgi:hypothetical protein
MLRSLALLVRYSKSGFQEHRTVDNPSSDKPWFVWLALAVIFVWGVWNGDDKQPGPDDKGTRKS